MRKKKLLTWLALLAVAGLITFIFRLELLNCWQQIVLKSIREKCVLANRSLVPGNGLTSHQIYQLQGLDRIWPHRVNSLRRLRYLAANFAGFECDIRFDSTSHAMYIAHDPQDIRSLQFKDYLQEKSMEQKLFWLDIKNIGPANIHSFYGELERLDRLFDFKKRVILESSSLGSLQWLDSLGWLVSYDWPGKATQTGTDSPALSRDYRGMVSQDFRMHDLLTRQFPGKKQLTWDIGFWNGMNRRILLQHANDSSFLVCLINVKSPGYQ